MQRIFIWLLFLLTFSAAAQTDQETKEWIAAERQHAVNKRARVVSVASNDYDVQYYRCYWNVNPTSRAISGAVMMRFRPTASTASITLDLHNQLVVDSVVYRGSNINFVQGTDRSLKLNFPASLPSGAPDSVRIHYRGTVPNTGYFYTTTHSGTPVLYTQSESYGASHWWPCKDANADKADSVDLYVSFPSSYTSSCNGIPVENNVVNGTRTMRWKHSYPIASYLVSIAVTNYTELNDVVQLPSRDMPMVVRAYPESVLSFQNALNTAKFCLPQFSALFSEYPFAREVYAQTQWNITGGMEHQTNSYIGTASASLVAHELGHQWFGDKITCRSWTDIWLNEGFASYMEFQYMLLTAPASRVAYLQGWTNTITASAGGSVYIQPVDTLNETRIFDNRLSYKKGGYLAVMLRWKLGDSAFFRGMRRYLNDPALAYGTALTADLQRNLEAESGQSLTEFFNDWLYGQGYPNYSAQWTPLSGGAVQVTLGQTQSHSSVSFFEMPVPLQFKNATRDTIVVANHTQNNQLFSFNLGFTPDTMIIDPQLWILSKTKTTQRLSTGLPELVPAAQWRVYPNPATTRVNIELPQGNYNGTEVRLFNAAGQLVRRQQLAPGSRQTSVSVHALAPGSYLLELSHPTKGTSRRQIVIAPR